MSAAQIHSGVVTAFDAHAGLGEIRSHNGEAIPFHCVAIADGSRDIEIGAAVEFVVRFHIKRDEAFEIRKK
ncbi:MAG: hypothetical protein RIR69_1391 [Actinomycetota bacterium]|jgi:cold shock CspA family protein